MMTNCKKSLFLTLVLGIFALINSNSANALSTACSDGLDNDYDGLVDAIDPGCQMAIGC